MVRQAFGLYRANFGASFLCFVPFVALTAAVFFGIVLSVTLRTDNVLLLILLRDVLRIVFSSLGVAAVVILVADRLAGRPGSVRASLAETMRTARPIVLGAGLAALPYAIAFFMFGPMAPFLRELFVGPPIVVTASVLERRRLGDALSRARELLDQQWSRVLLYLITVAAGVGLFDFVVQQAALRAVSAADIDVFGYALAVLVSVVVPSIVLPFVACVWLIAYFDLRARAEDFDEPALTTLRQSPPQ